MTELLHKFAKQELELTSGTDNVLYAQSPRPLGPVAKNTGQWLHEWAEKTPNAVAIAERSGDGWRQVTYAELLQTVRALAGGLLARGLGPDKPIAVLSGNGVDHGILALAAQYVGIPTTPIAEQYSLIHGAHNRLRHVINTVQPAMLFVSDADQYAEALLLEDLSTIPTVAVKTDGAPHPVTSLNALLKGGDMAAVDAAHASVGADTVAKYLFTSGSTSGPKGVITTQRMMCTNQAQIKGTWPFLGDKPPRIVDWLPWNHVFGGSHNFNMMLSNGGSLYIDHGKPTEKGFATSVKNIREIGCTISFNVPMAYAMLAKEMETDKALRRAFFADQDILFYAGASLPQETWDALKRHSIEERGIAPTLVSSWGMTETAPATLMIHEEIDRSGRIGVPVSGVSAKLIDDGDKRYELRVKGPNILPGYLRNPEKNKTAFDEEGYLITGDAVRFVDHDDPARGFKFDGRISEDFKLTTGTWVHASKLRLAAMETFGDIAQDLVITGQDRDQIGVLLFPKPAGLASQGIEPVPAGDVLTGKELQDALHARLKVLEQDSTGSSTHICRAMMMAEPPSISDGEITDKGNINQNKVQSRRKDLVVRLYDDADPATVTV